MNYNYLIKGEVLQVWNWNDEFHKEVTIYDKCRRTGEIRGFERTIRTDTKGKFFTWNKEKVYLDDFLFYTKEELKEKLEKGERVSSDDFLATILKTGVKNIQFMCKLLVREISIPIFGLSICGDKTDEVLCEIDERRYKINENYKIEFTPLNDNDKEKYANESYYISDLCSTSGTLAANWVKIV